MYAWSLNAYSQAPALLYNVTHDFDLCGWDLAEVDDNDKGKQMQSSIIWSISSKIFWTNIFLKGPFKTQKELMKW